MGIPFAYCHVSPKAIDLVAETLRSTWLNEGPRVREFEQALEAELGLKNVVTVNSDTSAMHLSLVMAGIGPWDEVILAPQTFIATGMVILMTGATPVFVDVDPSTGNIDPESVREHVTERTKAIMPVHWSGYPCDMSEISEIAKEHNLTVIEDAAHAIGATYQGKPIGTISRFTCFSFQSTKHVACGEGGAIVCRDEEDAELARRLRWFGVSRDEKYGWTLGERDAVSDRLGFKYHMNDITASIGLANLEGFRARLRQRQERGAFFRESLENMAPDLYLTDSQSDRTHSYWFFIVLVKERDAFVKNLARAGFPASVVHRRIDRHPVFRGVTPELIGQEFFEAHQIALPLHEGMTDDDCVNLMKFIREGWY